MMKTVSFLPREKPKRIPRDGVRKDVQVLMDVWGDVYRIENEFDTLPGLPSMGSSTPPGMTANEKMPSDPIFGIMDSSFSDIQGETFSLFRLGDFHRSTSHAKSRPHPQKLIAMAMFECFVEGC